MTESEFADRLRKYRKSKNMTQQELAERLGVSDKSVSRWENGSYPDVALLGPLAKELGVTVDDLLGTAPPVRNLDRSDLQNWLSYAFALGGGVGFYLLNTLLPTLLCYGAYLGLMAYGVYLQKNYTFHSRWFHLGNLVMNFFVNSTVVAQLLAYLLVFDGLSLTDLEGASYTLQRLFFGGMSTPFLLLLIARPVLAAGMTALTGWCIRQWWRGGARPFKFSFTPKNLTPAKVLPAVFPPVLAGYWMLYSADTAILPIWAYQHQGTVFMALWLISAVLTAAVLLLSHHRWSLVPAGVTLLMTLSFPRLCVSVRSIGLKLGNIYTEQGLNPNGYQRFLQADESLFVLAAVLSVLYLLFCCVKFWDSPPKMENAGENTGM